MNGLREKFRNKKGFTLVEMLIVVAIIAILIAISIPMVSSSLEKARVATDRANARDAISLAAIEVLTAEPNDPITNGTKWAYVVTGTSGSLVKDGTTGVKGLSADVKGTVLTVTYNQDATTKKESFVTTFDALLNVTDDSTP